ncbi:hypothetical protein RSAG8_01402, partial [Rhizoctonia solani AG-8 WAC10335]
MRMFETTKVAIPVSDLSCNRANQLTLGPRRAWEFSSLDNRRAVGI